MIASTFGVAGAMIMIAVRSAIRLAPTNRAQRPPTD
jgi:hypothetical protein